MIIKKNKWLVVNNQFGPQHKIMPSSLQDLLTNGFKKIDDCIYFCNTASEGIFSPDFVDRTGNECFFNKIQIDDFIESYSEPIELLNMGMLFILLLSEALESFSKEAFNVILSYDGKYCSVRFHKIRQGEIWLDENLESYSQEFILAIEVGDIGR